MMTFSEAHECWVADPAEVQLTETQTLLLQMYDEAVGEYPESAAELREHCAGIWEVIGEGARALWR